MREIAQELGLVTATKKDSQGLCFVGKVRLPDFLQQQLKPKEGEIIEIDRKANLFEAKVAVGKKVGGGDSLSKLAQPYLFQPENGTVVGSHQGAHYYTIGQRKGLHVGGKAEPLYVIGTDTDKNVVYVGMGDSHPGLYRKALFIQSSDIHWIREDLAMEMGSSRTYQVRIRYRQALQEATLLREPTGLYIHFLHPQRGITPGQFAAWYDGEELLGSGVIS